MREQATEYMDWVSSNYEYLKRKMRAYCLNKKVEFDEDIFSDTILKIFEKIEKNGMQDNTPKGLENYFFMSFKTNLARDKQYSRNTKKDSNISDDIEDVYESWYNATHSSPEEKIKKDLWNDYATLYLVNEADKNFDEEHSYLFRMKTFLPHMTYSKLTKLTGKRNVRQKVVDVRNYLRENVDKQDILRQFYDKYGNLL